VQLFTNDIVVEGGTGKSSQAYVFFGREKSLKIRVVLKQYKGSDRKSILSEIKIFTLLESLKKEESGSELLQVINKGVLVGLPHMLGYKVGKDFSEILMTHGGNSLEKWTPRLTKQIDRIDFAADMLRQIIAALKTLHSVGYSHGDLKLENICVRKDTKG
jgi:serine/threonine protein kinase